MACTLDFRCMDEGFGGKTAKRKREQQQLTISQSTMDLDTDLNVNPPPSKRSAISNPANPDKPVPLGKPTYDGVIAGKVSGRTWKQPRQRASSRNTSVAPKPLEQRKMEREIKKAYKERKNELKEEIRSHKVEKRKHKEEKDKKKQENILRSGTKLQKITNPKTLKKLAKSKKKKLLKVVPDDMLRK